MSLVVRYFVISLPLILVLVLTLVGSVYGQNVRVEAGDLGTIIGSQAWTSKNLSMYYVFHGIPYAESTLGEKRFKPSVLKTGPLTEDGSPFVARNGLIFCPQRDILMMKPNMDLREILGASMQLDYEEYENPGGITPMMGTEDCLVLNINTPKIPDENDKELLPVIFFVHGGSADSIWGSVFTGLRLLERPVVLVTINYRLGALGALNLGIDDAPGNAAMYDSITALKWVQRYIGHFGGDSSRVTLYGQSFGGVMVTHLMISPLAKDLFHGVIGASGSAISVWGTAPHPSIDNHLRVAFYANCYNYSEPLNVTSVYECMRDAPVELLRQAVGSQAGENQRAGGFGFDTKVPSIQSESLTIERFLSESPLEIMRKGEQSNVPLIMGANRHDGSFVLDSTYRKFIVANGHHLNTTFMKNDLGPTLLRNMGLEDKLGALHNALSMTYMGDTKNTGIFEEMLPGLLDIHSVFGMKAGAYTLVELHSKIQPNSFYYSFDYRGLWTTYDLSNKSNIPGGVAHIDDLLYTFYAFPLITARDQAVSNRMVNYFVNFAYRGDPNDPEGPIKFPKFSQDNHPFLKIDAEDSIGINCRDAWIGNSLELIKDGETTTENSPTTDENSNSTPDEESSKSTPTEEFTVSTIAGSNTRRIQALPLLSLLSTVLCMKILMQCF